VSIYSLWNQVTEKSLICGWNEEDFEVLLGIWPGMESLKAVGEGGALVTEPQTLVILPDIRVKFQAEGTVQVAQK
jgi:hypothetical protein